jgi:hypothetical protein
MTKCLGLDSPFDHSGETYIFYPYDWCYMISGVIIIIYIYIPFKDVTSSFDVSDFFNVSVP